MTRTEFPMTRNALASGDRGTLVVWGLVGSFPFGGMTWQVLHHLVGFQRLGFDVWYVEDSDRYVFDPLTFSRTVEFEANVATSGTT
jgi:hypothetical protein